MKSTIARRIQHKVVIIGGGPQGCMTAMCLKKLGHNRPGDLAIIEPNALMGDWFRESNNQGIDTLRTPWTVHLDATSPDPKALLKFAGVSLWKNPAMLNDPAPLHAFNEHARELVRRWNLNSHQIAGRVLKWSKNGDKKHTVHVLNNDGGITEISCDNVVMAVGLGVPHQPMFGNPSNRVSHSSQVDMGQNFNRKTICIAGGSLTGATLAVNMAEMGARVYLCCRSYINSGQLEVDPGWLPGSGETWRSFSRIQDWELRAKMIRSARQGRGVTPAILNRVLDHQANGRIVLHLNTEVRGWSIDDDGYVRVPGISDQLHQLVCATGYKADFMAIPFVRPLLEGRRLRVVDGLPTLGEGLSIPGLPGAFVTGRYAELRMGPLGRNFPGGRLAARIIAQAITRRRLNRFG